MENGLQVLMRGKKPTRRLLEYSLVRQGFPGLKHQEKYCRKVDGIRRSWGIGLGGPLGLVDYRADVE